VIRFLFEFKSQAHLTVRATGVFKAERFFAKTNQLIRPDANNRVGVRDTDGGHGVGDKIHANYLAERSLSPLTSQRGFLQRYLNERTAPPQ
jgi:hypothetical protein